MNQSKAIGWIILILIAFLFVSRGPLSASSGSFTSWQQQERAPDQQKEQEKEKKAEKEEDIGDSMKKRMDQGESMFEIIGIPSPEDYMPTTFEFFLLLLIPLSVIVAVVIMIMMITKRRHQRVMAMIEKGILPDAKSINSYRASQFRWDVFLLLTGLILGFGGIGFSLFSMGQKGADQWYVGVIPFLIGVALLVFHKIFYRKKKD